MVKALNYEHNTMNTTSTINAVNIIVGTLHLFVFAIWLCLFFPTTAGRALWPPDCTFQSSDQRCGTGGGVGPTRAKIEVRYFFPGVPQLGKLNTPPQKKNKKKNEQTKLLPDEQTPERPRYMTRVMKNMAYVTTRFGCRAPSFRKHCTRKVLPVPWYEWVRFGSFGGLFLQWLDVTRASEPPVPFGHKTCVLF